MFENIHYRLALYYLNKLRSIEALYQQGHEHSDQAFVLFDNEWTHIQNWQHWSATHAHLDDKIAYLCKEYSQSGNEMLTLRHHPQKHLEWLEAGLKVARHLGDTHAEMNHSYLLSRVHHALGSLLVAQRYGREALALAQVVNNPLCTSKILITLGAIYYSNTEYHQAQHAYEQALVLSETLEAKLEIGLTLAGLGNVAFAQGEYTYAQDYLVRALQIYEASGLPHHVCIALDDLSNLMLQMGNEDDATKYAKRCAALARTIGDQRHLALSLGVLGNLAKAQGNLTQAYEYFQQSLEISQLLGRPSAEVLASIRLGTLYLQLGELSAASQCFESALALPNASGFRFYSAIALMCLSQVFRRQGNLSQACLKLREGLEVALAINTTMIYTFYLLEAASLWYARGQIYQVATWIPFLDAHSNELDGEQLASFVELNEKLRENLGEIQFSRATNDGQTLNLEGVMHDILSELQILPEIQEI